MSFHAEKKTQETDLDLQGTWVNIARKYFRHPHQNHESHHQNGGMNYTYMIYASTARNIEKENQQRDNPRVCRGLRFYFYSYCEFCM